METLLEQNNSLSSSTLYLELLTKMILLQRHPEKTASGKKIYKEYKYEETAYCMVTPICTLSITRIVANLQRGAF